MTNRKLSLAVIVIGLGTAGTLSAQPVYRCEDKGKVVYSHEPCVGAKVVDTTPTQGLDKSSGVSRKGADVRRAEDNKAMADALRPILNETPLQRETRHRRAKLPAAAQGECAKIDPWISAPAPTGPGGEATLFAYRKRFRELGC